MEVTSTSPWSRTAVIALSSIVAIYGLALIVRNLEVKPAALHRSNALRRSDRIHFSVHVHCSDNDNGLAKLQIVSSNGRVFEYTIGDDAVPDEAAFRTMFACNRDAAQRLRVQITDAVIASSVKYMASHYEGGTGYTEPTNEALANIYGVDGTLHIVTDDFDYPIATLLGMDPDFVQNRIESRLYELKMANDDAALEEEQADPAVHEAKALLYHMAEDQSRRKAYLHRGIQCEDCGESPIRSIRWHCLNCPDYDLCSVCKVSSYHTRTHVFAEIQIPVPVLAQPVERLPVWYSGDPTMFASNLSATLRRQLSLRYTFEEDEVEALLVQFSTLVDTVIDDDPCRLNAAIGFTSFAASLSSQSWRKTAQSNLLFRRIFDFYDLRKKGSIDFESFLSAVAYLRGEKRFWTLDRAIKGFDLDNDGFISRDDMLRLLRAKFETHFYLMHEMAYNEIADQQYASLDTTVSSSLPVSSLFRTDDVARSDTLLSSKPRDGNGYPSHDGADEGGLSEEEKTVLGLTVKPSDTDLDVLHDSNVLDRIVSSALHSLLDKFFKEKEELYESIKQTAADRVRWQKEILALRESTETADETESTPSDAGVEEPVAEEEFEVEDESDSEEATVTQTALPTDAASLTRMEADLKQQSLEQLLDSSGYQAHTQASLDVAGQDLESAGAGSLAHGNDETSHSAAESNIEQASERVQQLDRPQVATSSKQLSGDTAGQDTLTDEYLAKLAILDKAAEKLQVRDGSVCLSVHKVASMANKDTSGQLVGLLRSWLEWASF